MKELIFKLAPVLLGSFFIILGIKTYMGRGKVLLFYQYFPIRGRLAKFIGIIEILLGLAILLYIIKLIF